MYKQKKKTGLLDRITTIIKKIKDFFFLLSSRDLNKYLIDHSKACLNQSIDLLIIIMSKSDNYPTRDAIRRTWVSGKNLGIYSSITMKYFFLIDFDEKLSRSIELENNLFHDIIQVDLPQQYTLVTYRVISMFEWSFRFCRPAKFLFKTDDDIFINFILLLKFISSLIEQPIDRSFVLSDMRIYGYTHIQPRVFRHATGTVLARYTITYDEYPCERYPTFLSGYGYLISKKARDAILYTAYQDPEPFRISDVYLTYVLFFEKFEIQVLLLFSLAGLFQIIYRFHVNQCRIILSLIVNVRSFLIIQPHSPVPVNLIMVLKLMFFEIIIDFGR
jgi:hypothetical protein